MHRSSSSHSRPFRYSREPPPVLHDKPIPIPSPITPAVTGLTFPSPIDTTIMERGRQNPVLMDSGSDPSSDEFNYDPMPSNDSAELVTPVDYDSLDQLWSTLRQQKEIKMAKEPSKVKSFEGVNIGSLSLEPSNTSNHSTPHSGRKHSSGGKKQSSVVTFRESSDGRSMMAFFKLPGLTKQDVHVSYSRNRLVVTWDYVIEVDERDDGDVIVQERREKIRSKTIPLPDGTKFEEVKAAMVDHHLVLRYPNPRASSIDTRSRSRDFEY